jgi:hypothetical protein
MYRDWRAGFRGACAKIPAHRDKIPPTLKRLVRLGLVEKLSRGWYRWK